MLKISTQTAGWYNREDPNGSFAFIHECGFEAVDFGIDGYLPVRKYETQTGIPESVFDKSEQEVIDFFEPVKVAADKNGITFAQMHAPSPTWVTGREDLTEYAIMAVKKCLAVCQAMECPALVVHPVRDADKDIEVETNMALFRSLLPAAVKTGVTVCIENLPLRMNGRLCDGACNTAAEVCYYVDTLNAEAGCDAFGYCFDVGHANLVGCNMAHHLKNVGHRLKVLHIHDNNGITDWHTAPYTCISNAGHQTDWDGFIKGLILSEYMGDINFETFRVLHGLPQQLKGELLRYIAATGRYFRERVQKGL